MASNTQESLEQAIEAVKRRLASYDCACSQHRPENCNLPQFLKDCACWLGESEKCKALANGYFRIWSGIRVYDPTVDKEERKRFNMNHCHRMNPAQQWAINARSDPQPLAPAEVRDSIKAVNGVADQLEGPEAEKFLRIGQMARRQQFYLDPRSGFKYGHWPHVHGHVQIRDPAECALNGTLLDDVQLDLDLAALSLKQQLRYYQAAFEAQEGVPPSFDYMTGIFGVQYSEIELPEKTAEKIMGPVTENTMWLSSQNKNASDRDRERTIAETHSALFSDAEIEHGQVPGFPLEGNVKEANLTIPSPYELSGAGIQGLKSSSKWGIGYLDILNALKKAGMSDQQMHRYRAAADEILEGKVPTFDHSRILSGKPIEVHETRAGVENKETRRRTRGQIQRTEDFFNALAQKAEASMKTDAQKVIAEETSERNKREGERLRKFAKETGCSFEVVVSTLPPQSRAEFFPGMAYASVRPSDVSVDGNYQSSDANRSSDSTPNQTGKLPLDSEAVLRYRQRTGLDSEQSIQDGPAGSDDANQATRSRMGINTPPDVSDEVDPDSVQMRRVGSLPTRPADLKSEHKLGFFDAEPKIRSGRKRSAGAAEVEGMTHPNAKRQRDGASRSPTTQRVSERARRSDRDIDENERRPSASRPSPGSNTSGVSTGFVGAMDGGFDRSIWPHRAGLGRYPEYIKKRGVKHMEDAIKYIEKGRLLGRSCEMNGRLEHPFGPNELFIAENGTRCSYCTSRNFGPKQCNPQFAGKSRKDESRHN